jgi:hypothetical protein
MDAIELEVDASIMADAVLRMERYAIARETYDWAMW